MKHKEEIELCTWCSGEGVRCYIKREPGHQTQITETKRPCDHCEGSGRLLKITDIIYEPWHSEEI